MRIIYEAEDGTFFDTPEECKQYEYESCLPMNDILGITYEDEIITYASAFEQGINFIEVVNVIYFRTRAAIVLLADRENCRRYEDFEVGVIYYYSDREEQFIPLDEEITYLKTKYEQLNTYADEMSEFVNTST